MIEPFEVRASRQSSRQFAAIRLEHNSAEIFELNRPQLSAAGLPDHAQCERPHGPLLAAQPARRKASNQQRSSVGVAYAGRTEETAPWRTRAPVSTTDK